MVAAGSPDTAHHWPPEALEALGIFWSSGPKCGPGMMRTSLPSSSSSSCLCTPVAPTLSAPVCTPCPGACFVLHQMTGTGALTVTCFSSRGQKSTFTARLLFSPSADRASCRNPRCRGRARTQGLGPGIAPLTAGAGGHFPHRAPQLPGENEKGELRVHCYVGHATNPQRLIG